MKPDKALKDLIEHLRSWPANLVGHLGRQKRRREPWEQSLFEGSLAGDLLRAFQRTLQRP